MNKTVIVLAVALLTLALVLDSGCSKSSKSVDPGQHDTTPPTVTEVDPPNGSLNVWIKPAITVIFSEPVDTATLKNGGITVSNASLQLASYLDTTNSSYATFAVTDSLQHNTAYTATVTTKVTDRAGNHLAQSYAWSFTTVKENQPPIVVSIEPTNNATDVSVDITSISITFSEPMDPTSINTGTISVVPNTGPAIPITVMYSGVVATITLSDSLEYFTWYTVEVATDVKDLAGNQMQQPFATSFQTEKEMRVFPGVTFGGSGFDAGKEMFFNGITQEATIAGYTQSIGAGSADMLLARVDDTGGVIWMKAYGTSGVESVASVSNSSSGGYLLLSNTPTPGAGTSSILLVETDPEGNELWRNTYSETDASLTAGKVLLSNGYIYVFGTYHFDPDHDGYDWYSNQYMMRLSMSGSVLYTKVINTEGRHTLIDAESVPGSTSFVLLADYWQILNWGQVIEITAIDQNGNVQNRALYGQHCQGCPSSWARDLDQGPGGGFVAVGTTEFNVAGTPMLMMRLGDNGSIVWSKTFNGSGSQQKYAYSFFRSNRGYLITGSTRAVTGDLDGYIAFTDLSGNFQWDLLVGGSNDDAIGGGVFGGDNYNLLTGSTANPGGETDVVFMKIDDFGNIID